MRGGIWIGTSGWVYKEWAGHFYPKGWPKKDEFSYYIRHFPTVEINATFYRLPTLKMVRRWHDRAPKGFVFAVKGSRFLTHLKRLKETGPGVRKYFNHLTPLGDRTGPILWQLPPNFGPTGENVQRLTRFLKKLPVHYQHAVEFREPSWINQTTRPPSSFSARKTLRTYGSVRCGCPGITRSRGSSCTCASMA
jgi:uncharacterized protein YecE (DUF72 family)